MEDKVNYYQDREEDSTVFKYDWSANAGFVWNYKKNGWVSYGSVIDQIYGDNLRVISEKMAMHEIERNK